VWSPDGSRVVFDSNRKAFRDLYMKASNNTGADELLLESSEDKHALDWSRDGRFLLYTSVDPQTPQSLDIWVLPMEGDRKPYPWLKTAFDERRAALSPDGRWVAYESNESGRPEIYVRPFAETASGNAAGGQVQVSTSGGIAPRWRSDGGELYYIAPDARLMAAPIVASRTAFESASPVALFQTRIVEGGINTNTAAQYDVSSDGRFLIATVLDDTTSLTLLQNWTLALQR
jgi:hypothetical protein